MKLMPLHDGVVVKRVEKERKIAAGIVIPATAGEKPDQGEVIAVGPGKRCQDGQTVRAGCEGWRPCAVREVRGRDRCRLRGSEKETVTCTGRQKACAMKRRLCVLVPAAVIAGLWSENAMSASPPLPTLPLQYDIWITGTIQRGSGKYAPGDYTTIMLDRPSTSPCNDKEVSDILLGEGGAPAPTLLLPYLNERVAVRGRVICPGSGIQFTPQPDVVFPVW